MMRRSEEFVFKILMAGATAVIFCLLLFILLTVAAKGLPLLTLGMLTKTSGPGFYLGRGGGILNAIAGSLLISTGAVAAAFCLGFPAAIGLNFYDRGRRGFAYAVRLCLDVLWGVPSIVYGAAGFAVMAFFHLKASVLGGMITVTFLILPVITRTADEVLKTVSGDLVESSYALGATRLETVLKVVFRKALPGITTAVLISFGRAIGDGASLMFTAGFSDYVPGSLTEPAATLPLSVFYQFSSPIEEVRNCAYASALVLIIIVLVLSAAARIICPQRCLK